MVQATAWGAAAREGCSLLLIWPQEDPGTSRADSGKDGEGSRGHAELAGPLRPRGSVPHAKEDKDGTHGRDTLAPARQTFPFPRAMVAGLFKTLWPFVPCREERDVAGWLSRCGPSTVACQLPNLSGAASTLPLQRGPCLLHRPALRMRREDAWFTPALATRTGCQLLPWPLTLPCGEQEPLMAAHPLPFFHLFFNGLVQKWSCDPVGGRLLETIFLGLKGDP